MVTSADIGWTWLALLGAGRGVELAVSSRNARRALARGGVESGRGHYPAMVALHTGLLVGALLEVLLADRPFHGWLGWPMLALVLAAQALRWWCIRTLGPQWSTRVVVLPGAPLVTSGPYRWMAHPNYLAVVVEGVALPLVHTAWVTAVAFTVLNALLLRVRIGCEARTLHELAGPPAATT